MKYISTGMLLAGSEAIFFIDQPTLSRSLSLSGVRMESCNHQVILIGISHKFKPSAEKCLQKLAFVYGIWSTMISFCTK